MPDGTYWVTGGLGALGLFTAEWLAAKGAGHIVLTGRNHPTPAAEKKLAEIRQKRDRGHRHGRGRELGGMMSIGS